MQRWTVYPRRGEVVQVGTVMAIVRMVGRHIDRVRGDGYRTREQYLLPA